MGTQTTEMAMVSGSFPGREMGQTSMGDGRRLILDTQRRATIAENRRQKTDRTTKAENR